MRCVRCGLPSKNYEMSNDGRPAADPYARLDAAYLLGALDADERLAYEAHLAICRRCRAGLAEISAIPSLLAGLDESRARRRWLTTGLGPLAAACAIALIVIVVPSSSGPKRTPGNNRARRHSGRRHRRPAPQIMGYRDRPDLLVPTQRCRAVE